jgi:TIR domain
MTTSKASLVPGVFISHRGSDADVARRLAEEIKRLGYNVWLDEWEILLGDSVVERINAGLENAKYVIVCYSDAGVLSNWMSREWMSALARKLEGHSIQLLPVRLSGGAPPAILADIRYADLVKDWDGGIKELLQAMR